MVAWMAEVAVGFGEGRTRQSRQQWSDELCRVRGSAAVRGEGRDGGCGSGLFWREGGGMGSLLVGGGTARSRRWMGGGSATRWRRARPRKRLVQRAWRYDAFSDTGSSQGARGGTHTASTTAEGGRDGTVATVTVFYWGRGGGEGLRWGWSWR